jgi:hypothetical protein
MAPLLKSNSSHTSDRPVEVKIEEDLLYILDYFTWAIYIIQLPEKGEPGILNMICDHDKEAHLINSIALDNYEDLTPENLIDFSIKNNYLQISVTTDEEIQNYQSKLPI